MKSLLKAFFENQNALFLALVLVPFLTYVKACYFDFSPLDDVWLIINNEEIIKNWSNLGEAFKQATSEMYYRPLLFDSFIIDYHIKGMNAHVFHFTNIVWHVALVNVLFRFLKQYDVKKEVAFAFAILYAVHPVMLHAVAWVPGRNDAMLGLFCLASLYHQNAFLKKGNKKNVVLQFLFLILALFTKETAIVMPLAFALNAYAQKIQNKRIGIEFAFALMITLAWYFYRASIVKEVGVFDGELSVRLKNFVSSFLIYTGKTVYPIQQSLYPTIENSSIWFGALSLIVIALALFFLKFSNKRYGYLGIALYLLFLFVPIWFVSVSVTREQYENRLYAPMIGLVLFAANLKIDETKQMTRLCFGIIFVVYAATTFVRMDNYKDYMSYIEKCIDDNPNNYFFHERMADELAAQNDLRGAVEHYSEAIRILPSRALFYNNRGNVYTTLKMKTEALRDMDSAVTKSKFDPRVCLNRAVTYAKFNETDIAMRELERLKQCCGQSVVPEAENEIRMRWTMNGFAKIDELLKQQPNNAVLYANRAKLFNDIGRKSEALADKQKALSLAPDNEQIKRYLENIK